MVKYSKEKNSSRDFYHQFKTVSQHVKLLGQIKGIEVMLIEPVLKPKINAEILNINVVIN